MNVAFSSHWFKQIFSNTALAFGNDLELHHTTLPHARHP